MQGRITKVLNMKPPEILGLLEEAAGTKMYETKKQAAMRTLDKKQVKVEEINKVRADRDDQLLLWKIMNEKRLFYYSLTVVINDWLFYFFSSS